MEFEHETVNAAHEIVIAIEREMRLTSIGYALAAHVALRDELEKVVERAIGELGRGSKTIAVGPPRLSIINACDDESGISLPDTVDHSFTPDEL